MAGGDRFTPEEDAEILATYAAWKGVRGWAVACAKKIGRNSDSILHRRNILVAKAAPAQEMEHASPFTNKPLSVDDLVRLFKIDLETWEPYHVTPNVWQMGAKHPETGEIITAPLYQTKVRFRRKPAATNEQLKAALLSDIAADTKRRAKGKPPRLIKRDDFSYCLEVDVFDLHLGKFAWGAETAQDYDSNIAYRVAQAAVNDLLEQASRYRLSQILLPFGNDFFQADNAKGQTTAGTQVDHDTRFHKMFRAGRALASWMIEACAAVAPVHVPVVPGNHDEQTAFTMGVVLEAEFARDKRVTFDNSPKPRKYYRFGQTLLGYTHGKEEPHGKLPSLMALEAKEDWFRSTCREFHIGHLHTGRKAEPLSVGDDVGCTVRWIRSLSATDSWHSKRGFVGNQRGAEAFVWKHTGGLRAHFITEPVAA